MARTGAGSRAPAASASSWFGSSALRGGRCALALSRRALFHGAGDLPGRLELPDRSWLTAAPGRIGTVAMTRVPRRASFDLGDTLINLRVVVADGQLDLDALGAGENAHDKCRRERSP